MPDSETAGRSGDPASPYNERNLPVPVRPVPEAGTEGLFSRLARAIFGWRGGPTRAELEVVLESALPGETGVLPAERAMLQNILSLRGRRIEDVMVPRADIVSVQQDISLGELIKVFEIAAHSRLVVYNDTLDDPLGMVHIRDLIAFMTARAAMSAAKSKRKKALPAGLDFKGIDLGLSLSSTGIVREMLFVPPSMPALDLLAKMQATHIHLALVVDEYGGTDGLVSIEDIVEQIVGDISDEHDEDELPVVVRQPDGSFVADARANLEDVAAAIGTEFDIGDMAKEVDTIGGYLMAQGGRLPLRGELVAGPPGFEIEVLDADPRRIKKVRIHLHKNRPISRDSDGRRSYSTPEAPPQVITALPPQVAAGEDKSSSNTMPPKAPDSP